MPTVLRAGPYDFHFYSTDGHEPAHVHVRRDRHRAKVWLRPVSLAWSSGFTRHDLRHILMIVQQEHELLLRSWDEYFRR